MGKVDSLQLVANFQTRLKVAFKHLKRLYISIRLMFRNKQSKSSQMSFYDESERQFAWKRWKIITVLLSFHSNVSLIMPFGLIRKFSTYFVKNFYLHRHSNSRPATEALYCTISPAGGCWWLYTCLVGEGLELLLGELLDPAGDDEPVLVGAGDQLDVLISISLVSKLLLFSSPWDRLAWECSPCPQDRSRSQPGAQAGHPEESLKTQKYL